MQSEVQLFSLQTSQIPFVYILSTSNLKVSSHSAYRYVDGPDDGSDESQTEGQDINDARNYNQPELNGEAYYEEVIQKLMEWF